MNYRDAIEFLFNSLPMYQRTGKAAYKANLNNTLALDRYFGHPHTQFRSIHIAGTNGKGSVSHMLASIFQSAGFKTGLYTSPHLLDFRERIRINGDMIPEKEVISFVRKHSGIIHEIEPSFFEMTVAMAFDYFARSAVDVAIIETGLGGRLDSTNIITPDLSVITNISLDHTEFLGDSIPGIAREKAGIIKPGIPVVIGTRDDACASVFIEKAATMQCDLLFASDRYAPLYSTYTSEVRRIFRITEKSTGDAVHIESDMTGDFQEENIITSLTAVDVLRQRGWVISQEWVIKGLGHVKNQTGLRGRWDILGENPRMVCDTGHNAAGMERVIKQIRNTPWKHLHMVLGFVNDKDLRDILSMLPRKASYYFTRSSVPRALEATILKESASAYGLQGTSYPSVQEALEAAKQAASSEDMIFIGGSTFVVADLLGIV